MQHYKFIAAIYRSQNTKCHLGMIAVLREIFYAIIFFCEKLNFFYGPLLFKFNQGNLSLNLTINNEIFELR